MANQKVKIILDVDTGSDDALAILLAIKSKKIDIIGITTVAGNINLKQVTINTLKVLNLAERLDTPVFKGNSKPLEGKGKRARTHGKDGICGVVLPSPNQTPQEISAEEFILERVSSYPKKIVIVATGPLTNIAQVFKKKPEVKKKIKKLIIMGGAIEVPGNITPFAEFNFFNDPRAARIVLKGDTPVILIPLDITQRISVSRAQLFKKYKKSKDLITRFVINLINNRCRLIKKDRFYLHDPLAVGVAINRNFVKIKRERLRIITAGREKGQIVKDKKGQEIEWAFKVKEKGFLNYFERQLLK